MRIGEAVQSTAFSFFSAFFFVTNTDSYSVYRKYKF